jgi:hypothetical protein
MSAADAPARELTARIGEHPMQPRELARMLDGLSHAQRVEATRSLGRTQQRRLYEAVDGFLPVRLCDLVPPSVADFTPVRHFGKNTLPAFTHFEKRFCRPREADAEKPGQLYGFNFQPLAWVSGPGYFVAREDPSRPEVWIDYRQLPPAHPAGWPEIRPNDRGLARFVYGFMVDTLRRVSEHVTIGSAARRGRDLGSWFVLCRQD